MVGKGVPQQRGRAAFASPKVGRTVWMVMEPKVSEMEGAKGRGSAVRPETEVVEISTSSALGMGATTTAAATDAQQSSPYVQPIDSSGILQPPASDIPFCLEGTLVFS